MRGTQLGGLDYLDLLDQITYVILVLYSLDFLRGGENTVSKDDHLKPHYIIDHKGSDMMRFFQTISEKNFHSYHYITLWFSEIVNYKWPSIQSMPTKWQMGRRPLLLIIWWTYTFTVFFENQIFLKYYITYTYVELLHFRKWIAAYLFGNTMYVWEYFAHMTYHNFPWGSVCNDKNSEYIYIYWTFW